MGTRVTSDYKLYTGEINESGYIEEPETTLSQELLETGTTNLTLQSKCADTGLKIDWDKPFRINMYFKLPSSAIGTTVFLFGESETGFRVVVENKTVNQQQLYNIVLYSYSNSQQAMLAHPSYTFNQLSADVGYYVSFTWDASSGTYKTYSLTVSTKSFDSSGTNGTTDLGAWGQTDAMSTGVSSNTLKLFQPSYTSNYPAFYSNTFIGMPTGESNEQEKEVNYINPSFGDNTLSCTRIVENSYLDLANGSKYLKIFSHDIRDDQNMFKNQDDAKFNIASSNRFSRLEDIPLFTTNDSTQVGVSGLQSRVDGTNLWFSFGNQSTKNVICNIKLVLTKNNGSQDIVQYTGFNIGSKKMYYVLLPETTYNYANIYFDDDYSYFIWDSSFSQGFYLTYGWGKSEDILFQIGNKLNYLVPGYSALGISSNDFWIVGKPKYEFLLNYSPEFRQWLKTPGGIYIDTGLTPTQDFGIEIVWSTTDTSNSVAQVFGGGGSAYNDKAFECYPWDGFLQLNFGSSSINTLSVIANNIYTIRMMQRNVYVKNETTGEVFNGLHIANTFTSARTLCLFDINRTTGHSTAMYGKIHKCKIYNGSTLVRDLVPTYSSPSYKFYDKITGNYYGSSSSYLQWGSDDLSNRWKQTANPLITQSNSSQTITSMGYEPIEINMTSQWDYGMGLSSSPNESYLDCNAGSPDWFGGIGQYVVWNNGFPAPDGSARKFVELYIRIDNVEGWTGRASIRNNKCIFMDEFIEE